MVQIINFMLGIYNSISAVSADIIEFMSREYEILGESFTVSEMLFGSGVTVVLVYVMIKFVADIFG